MKRLFSAFALAVLLIVSAFVPAGIDASNRHFVVTNNNVEGPNSATLMELSGSALSTVRTFATGGTGFSDGFGGLNEVLAVQNGDYACIFVSDDGTNDIAAFIYPAADGMHKVGNFQGPGGDHKPDTGAIGMAARGNALATFFIPYMGFVMWTINPDCSITQQSTTEYPNNITGMTITPDGKTLLVGQDGPQVDSFSIGADGSLTELGPYPVDYAPSGADVTKNGKYAIFGEYTGLLKLYNSVVVYPINSDGTLGLQIQFQNLAPGGYTEYVQLGPDEKYLYVSDNSTFQVLALAFSENPLNVSFADEIAANNPNNFIQFLGHLSVIPPSNDGLWFVTAERGSPNSAVALYRASHQGQLEEAPGSPFMIDNIGESGLRSIAVYPPRSF